MEFSKRTLAASVQLLGALPTGSAFLLLQKAGISGYDLNGSQQILWAIESSAEACVRELLTDLVVRQRSIRADAATKYVFDERLEEVKRCLLLDGWTQGGQDLAREYPSSSEQVAIRDALDDELADSDVDSDSAIRMCLEQSARSFSSSPPDFNASSTNVRVALETAVRRAAQSRAIGSGDTVEDRWGPSVQYLRSSGLLSKEEEDALTASYTATSPGAHVPKGLSEREWARMIRALDLAWLHYVLKRHAG